MKLTWLGALNALLLQWAFVRLVRVVAASDGRTLGYKWLTGVVPLTGWWSDYRYVRGPTRQYRRDLARQAEKRGPIEGEE